ASAPPPPAGATHSRPQTDISVSFPGIKSSVSDSPKRLVLTGTVLGRSPHEGTAFIGVDARNPQTYSAGAVLANGAHLTLIYKDHVVVEQNGRTALLYLTDRQPRAASDRSSDLLTVGGRTAAPEPAVANSSESFTD